MTQKERQQRLDAVAEKMKTAKGAELDALTKEVDQIIGFDDGDAKYNPEADGAWEIANGRKP